MPARAALEHCKRRVMGDFGQGSEEQSAYRKADEKKGAQEVSVRTRTPLSLDSRTCASCSGTKRVYTFLNVFGPCGRLRLGAMD